MNKLLQNVVVAALMGISGSAAGFDFGTGSGPYGYGPNEGPYHGTGRPSSGVRLERTMSEGAYVLTIHLNGIEPAAIEVVPWGRGLRIRSNRWQQQSRDDGRGMYYQAQRMSNFSRFVPVPRDANVTAMTREETPDLISITIPRSR